MIFWCFIAKIKVEQQVSGAFWCLGCLELFGHMVVVRAYVLCYVLEAIRTCFYVLSHISIGVE